ncbi:ATP-dependent protease ATPase subunit HslU [bacterium]|nr:ATP-dependent protease ATPase subunit HslU [bacterium]
MNNELEKLTPPEVVRELDKYIVGQQEGKRAVAVALRNRWRRQQLEGTLRDEIQPKNILMMGPTGVGKTEIARRVARLTNAPFVKVEATKYTEVGYVGKDVESMVRDLVETAINMVKQQERDLVAPKAREHAEERVLDLLLPPGSTSAEAANLQAPTRDKFREMLRRGELNDREVTLDVKERVQPNFEIMAFPGMEEVDTNLRDMLGNMLPKKNKRRHMKVKDAFKALEQEESSKLVDMERVIPKAIKLAEQNGIIFLDELDKIAEARDSYRSGAGVSREGVQRDLLPIVEGSNVTTKYGMVKTDHVLFIGAGAFHQAKPSDLIPELQGRFPIRVELQSLTTDDFYRILTEPQSSLVKQYAALMKTEGLELTFTEDAIREVCEIATAVNERTENIGARRLHTILEKVLDEVSFNASERRGEKFEITPQYVRQRVGNLVENVDLSRYIL